MAKLPGCHKALLFGTIGHKTVRYGCFHKLGGPLLGVLVIRAVLFWGLYSGP